VREQEIISNFFGKDHGIFVDVGAYGPEGSNTYHLLNRGWKGFLIEADKRRVQVLKASTNGNATIINIGIGDRRCVGCLFLYPDPRNNTFLNHWARNGNPIGTQIINVRPLADVLEANNVPKDFDLLSIDTEGMDYRIMRKFMESDYRPRLIVTEAISYGDLSIFKGYRLLTKTYNGYRDWIREAVGRNTYGNLFMVKENGTI